MIDAISFPVCVLAIRSTAGPGTSTLQSDTDRVSCSHITASLGCGDSLPSLIIQMLPNQCVVQNQMCSIVKKQSQRNMTSPLHS